MNATDMQVSIACGSLEDTQALAAALARVSRGGDCILLRGDLGAGKTAFARAFIQALCPEQDDIVSPTFTLVQTYPSAKGTIWHFDLYRLKSAAEIVETGLEEALQDGILLVEWPELAQDYWPPEALDVGLAIGNNSGERIFTFSGLKGDWQARLHSLKEQ